MQTVTTPSVDERTVVSVPWRDQAVEIPGQILYVERGMGFAMKFSKLTSTQIEALTAVLGEPPGALLMDVVGGR